jgi:hypothetical protein
MKVDAHCAFDKGFDVKMMEAMQDDWTMVPIMRNLHAFDWVCPDGHRRYQSPSGPCKECGKETVQDILWRAKKSPQSTSYCFDSTLHFQYFGQYKAKQEGDLVETMSLQGSCFMMTRAKYWELDICDEAHGSWGQQGTEVACKTWLSGGRVIVNKLTWYAHMFRTQGGDFGFPYPQSGKQVEGARQYSRALFLDGKWTKATRPLSWLINKFDPPYWKKGIIYYTDNILEPTIAEAARAQLKKVSEEKGLPIVSASLQPLDFGAQSIHLPLQRGYLAMFRQQLAALEASKADIIFFCEHDVLYHPSHFDFVPLKRNVFYYNVNVWKVRAEDGLSIRVNECVQVSGLCGWREELIKHYRERVEMVETHGYPHGLGFEPGSRNEYALRDGTPATFEHKYAREYWESELPNVDIRHKTNLTLNRWDQTRFRHRERDCAGWTEAWEVPGWGKVTF